MKIAVLFDGAGLARLGLEQAGHECTGFEIDPAKHYLSQMVGSGNSILADVRDIDLQPFDAIWASPPCQQWSDQNHGTATHDDNLLDWSLALLDRYPDKTIWVENVESRFRSNDWGVLFNAAQFLETPIQNRNRIIGGRYPLPYVYRPYQHSYRKLNICPAVMATERNHGGLSLDPKRERRKASLWYGREMAISEMDYHQGLEVPNSLLKSWYYPPPLQKLTKRGKLKDYTFKQWIGVLSHAIGNGVPVYMAKAFGEAVFSEADPMNYRALPLFENLSGEKAIGVQPR